jgi:DNA repair protein RadC
MQPRERYTLLGPDVFGDIELIVLILGTGAGGRSALSIGASLLERFGSVAELADASVGAIAEVRGVGPARAIRLHAALALGRRAAIRLPTGSIPVRSPADALPWFQAALQGLDHEELHALYLDRRFRPVRYRRVSSGSDAATVVEPRQILKTAVELGASALVVAHNHPSGASEPSPEDRLLTRRLFAGAETLGIRLIDHLIIAGERWASLAERGELA